jgi:hypothetical protein
VLTTVSTDNVQFARELGACLIIDYKKQRFEDEASDLDMVFDLIDGETRERSWKPLKKGGILVTTLTDPSQDKAKEHGVRATRYAVEEDGSELAEIAELVTSGKVKPHVQKTYPMCRTVLISAFNASFFAAVSLFENSLSDLCTSSKARSARSRGSLSSRFRSLPASPRCRLRLLRLAEILRHLEMVLESRKGLAGPVLQFGIFTALGVAFEKRHRVLVGAHLHGVEV